MLDFIGWRGVFASLFGVGLLILAGGAVFMKNVTAREDAELNLTYVSLSSTGFVAFMIGVSNIGIGLVSLRSGGLMALGLVLLGIFAALQLEAERPMLNLRVFRHPQFRIAVILSLCLYLISMGTGMIMPIFTKAICGFSDTAYGLATLGGSFLSMLTTLYAGRVYDRVGIRPAFIVGTCLYAGYAAMGLMMTQSVSIVDIAAAFALQSLGMATLNSPTTTLALSGLEGKERVDGSAIFNTLRQISSSLASTLAVLIFTLLGSSEAAIHGVFLYFTGVTAAIAAAVILYLRKAGRQRA